jgi:type IV secretory pathway TrbD component
MLDRAAKVFDDTLADTLKVVIPNSAVLATINIVTLKEWAEFGLILLSAAYTVWQWRRVARRDKQ